MLTSIGTPSRTFWATSSKTLHIESRLHSSNDTDRPACRARPRQTGRCARDRCSNLRQSPRRLHCSILATAARRHCGERIDTARGEGHDARGEIPLGHRQPGTRVFIAHVRSGPSARAKLLAREKNNIRTFRQLGNRRAIQQITGEGLDAARLQGTARAAALEKAGNRDDQDEISRQPSSPWPP